MVTAERHALTLWNAGKSIDVRNVLSQNDNLIACKGLLVAFSLYCDL
jgi:hypothetical protein